jgi:hypothetical protein
MTTAALSAFCHARSGDKGDSLTLSVFASVTALYPALCRELTAGAAAAHLGVQVAGGRIQRWELPALCAVHLVLHGALDGGAAASLRSDPLGKAFGSLILELRVELMDDELALVPELSRPLR